MCHHSTVLGLLLGSALGLAAQAPPAENPAAVREARRCHQVQGEEGVRACRRALGFPVTPRRAAALRDALAAKLVRLGRWDELVEVRRESAEAQKDDARAQLLYGEALLGFKGDATRAEVHLREAVRLKDADAEAHGALARALALQGRWVEARSAFAQALTRDPAWLDSHPGSRPLYEAAQAGRR
jgi:Flp pilus assembly protein TadD